MGKSQRRFVMTCSILALVGAVVWWITDRSLQPVVVFLTGLAGLAAIYWPFRPRYARRRLKGNVSFDYTMNNSIFAIGNGELQFETQWSKASDTAIHCYRDRPSVTGIAIAIHAARIADVRDASQYEMSSRSVTPREGEIVVMRNNFGNFAAIRIADVKDRTRDDDRDELALEYVINPGGGTDFA